MVAERSWILGVFVGALTVPIACGGISVSRTSEGDAGTASGGVGANGGNGSGTGPGAGGGVSPNGGTVGGTTPVGGAIQAGGSGPMTGGKGSVGTGGSFTGGTGAVSTGGSVTGSTGAGAMGAVPQMGGTGGTLPRPDPRIPWDANGFISGFDNSFGVQGTWYLATDCESTGSADLPCTERDPSLIGPDMQPGWATSPDKVCMRGVAPKIVNNPVTGMPAYDLQWGALFGFNLADGGAYNADIYGVRGFVFDITANFEARIRANVVTAATVGIAHFVELRVPTVNQTLYFSDALQGDWVTAQVPLDTTALTSIEFHVYTNTSAATPFDVCVSNLRVIPW